MKICTIGDFADVELISLALAAADALPEIFSVNSEEALLQLSQEPRFYAVFADMTMLRRFSDCSIRQLECRDRFEHLVLIAPSADYEYAYQAMKLHASELLIRPISTSEVESAFCALASESGARASRGGDREAARKLFAADLPLSRHGQAYPMSVINDIYGSRFRDGCFQVVTIAVYHPSMHVIISVLKLFESNLLSFIERTVGTLTFDLLHATVYNEYRLVLNFDSAGANYVAAGIPSILAQAERLAREHTSAKVYLGLGGVYREIGKLTDSRRESIANVWRHLSASRENGAPERKINNAEVAKTAKALELKIRASLECLNVDNLVKYVNQYFNLPESYLSSPEGKNVILGMFSFFFNTHMEGISVYTDADAYYYITKQELLASSDFTQFKYRFISLILDTVNKLKALVEQTNPDYIIKAKEYVSVNYTNKITLEEVAKHVCLNPSYFSRVFKQMTGCSFFDYVTDYRIDTAKKLLQATDYRVGQIGRTVGYPDQRYFSKTFRSRTGTTPSEYRAIFDMRTKI